MRPRREEILRIIAENRDAIRACGALRLALFGSVARGEAREDSDADFIVELNRKTFDNYMDLKYFLQDLFGRKIDLVTIQALKPQLKEDILRGVIYA